MEFVCPKPDALTTVIRHVCPENLGQIQRVIIQRPGFEFDANAGTPNPITALASWTPLLTAVGDTKIVITPNLVSFVIPQGEAQTIGGGDNSTIDGVEEVVGTGPITVTCDLSGVPVKIITQLRKLMESETDLVVYMINQYAQIICRELDPIANPGDVYGGIPIAAGTFFVPYPGNAGYGTKDLATMRFGFAEDWAKDRALVKGADFNAKTQLIAPVS
jgi:hypothetical protein